MHALSTPDSNRNEEEPSAPGGFPPRSLMQGISVEPGVHWLSYLPGHFIPGTLDPQGLGLQADCRAHATFLWNLGFGVPVFMLHWQVE